MNIELSLEQQNEILVSTLTTDYQRILSGYYECETLQYREAFEKLFEFYLTGQQLKEMTAYSWSVNK